MANSLVSYDPIWYANRAIERLEKNLNVARTIFRAYDGEPRERGSTIRIRKPGGMAAQNMPIATPTDITPVDIDITLSSWKGVEMALSDKELAYTGERIINEHIAPAIQKLAEAIEQSCVDLYADVPWVKVGADPATIADIIALRKLMADNYVPKSNRFLMLSSEREADLLAIDQFLKANESSDGTATQREGSLGRKYGFDVFQNDLVPTHTPGTLATVGTVAINNGAGYAAGVNVINIDAVTSMTGTLVKGDTLTIAGAGDYAVTALATAAGNAITGLAITPPLRSAVADNAVVTINTVAGGQKLVSLAYQQEWAAIAMAALPMSGNGRGAEQATVTDPRTNLAIRVTRWYEPSDTKTHVRFDALWGVRAIDGDRAVRYHGPLT